MKVGKNEIRLGPKRPAELGDERDAIEAELNSPSAGDNPTEEDELAASEV